MIRFDSRRERRVGGRGGQRSVAALAGCCLAAVVGCADILGLNEDPAVSCEAGARTCVLDTVRRCDSGTVIVEVTSCSDKQQVCSEGACQDVEKLAAGGSTTCALLSGGGVLCWGLNAQGQCGQAPAPDDPTDARLTPVRVDLPVDGKVIDIAVGGDAESGHACALTDESEVWCWGDNRFSQVGPPLKEKKASEEGQTEIPQSEAWALPQDIRAQSYVHEVEHVRAGPGRTCVIGVPSETEDPEGRRWLWCWGRNTEQQMIPGHLSELRTPTPVPDLTGVTDVAFGLVHTCALAEGKVYCWGSAAAVLGGAPGGEPVGMTEIALDGHLARSITAGDHHTCATTDAGVYCWGSNSCGQVSGDVLCFEPCGEAPACHIPPILVEPLPQDLTPSSDHPYLVAAGARRTCAQWPSGDVKCWGRDKDGLAAPAGPMIDWLPDLAAAELVLGSQHACARLTGSEVRCWGRNDHGQLGQGDTRHHEAITAVSWYDYEQGDFLDDYRD